MFRGRKAKKFFSILLAAVMALTLLAGCGGGGEASQSGSGSIGGTQTTDLKVGFILNGLLGSQSFDDVIVAGIEKAQAELGFEYMKAEKVEAAQAADTVRTMVQQGCNYIIFNSAVVTDPCVDVMKENPDVMFLSIDYDLPDAPDNLCCVSYREQEAAFLTGAFCELMSKTGKVAFIGGNEGGTMVRFEAGFRTGARYVNKDAKVSVSYVGFQDANKGKETATMLYNQGYDWIAGAAASSNLGIFQASEELGGDNWVCGAADGQFHLMPSRIVVSQVKRVDNVAYNMLKEAAEGNFQGGAHLNMGLKEEGVDMLYTDKNDELLAMIPEEVTTRIEELRQAIIDGEIVVPASNDEIESFKFPE